MEFYNPRVLVDKTRHKLPHWQQGRCPFTVTFRLDDALPQALMAPWRRARYAWLAHHPKPWDAKTERAYHQTFTNQIQQWLDAGYGTCVLRTNRVAALVADVLQANDHVTHELWAWVVMPNHVHVLAGLLGEAKLPLVLQQWKGTSSKYINTLLHRSGRLWQPEYFDRLVRSPRHFAMALDYIRDNPSKAGLSSTEFLWWEHPAARTMLDEMRDSTPAPGSAQDLERGL